MEHIQTVKVQSMRSTRSNKPVANQFIITTPNATYFQSYDSVIACKSYTDDGMESLTVYLDAKYWDYSTTTGKYRNEFLGEGISETRRKIADGTYKLVDLNHD